MQGAEVESDMAGLLKVRGARAPGGAGVAEALVESLPGVGWRVSPFRVDGSRAARGWYQAQAQAQALNRGAPAR